jgi:hypothetical protein
VTNGRQKCMDADCDHESNRGEQADGYQQNAEGSYLAAGGYQHGGVSVPHRHDTAKHHRHVLRWGGRCTLKCGDRWPGPLFSNPFLW